MRSNTHQELDTGRLSHPLADFPYHRVRGVTVRDAASGYFPKDKEGNDLLDGFTDLWWVRTGYGHKRLVKTTDTIDRRSGEQR